MSRWSYRRKHGLRAIGLALVVLGFLMSFVDSQKATFTVALAAATFAYLGQRDGP